LTAEENLAATFRGSTSPIDLAKQKKKKRVEQLYQFPECHNQGSRASTICARFRSDLTHLELHTIGDAKLLQLRQDNRSDDINLITNQCEIGRISKCRERNAPIV
jgi:hypothetical protein